MPQILLDLKIPSAPYPNIADDIAHLLHEASESISFLLSSIHPSPDTRTFASGPCRLSLIFDSSIPVESDDEDFDPDLDDSLDDFLDDDDDLDDADDEDPLS